jgi:AraC family transcriptional regulator, regulatory protein of adaptative response / DNA-3-methyladenine glycosylase II
MTLDFDVCYRALRARDARFDGRFFVAVSSTRIYCLPVCTVKPPKRENCRFFPSAAAAEAGGYRPCLRCRPELAPGNANVDATTRLAQAAASMMEDRALDDEGLDAVAARLGIQTGGPDFRSVSRRSNFRLVRLSSDRARRRCGRG